MYQWLCVTIDGEVSNSSYKTFFTFTKHRLAIKFEVSQNLDCQYIDYPQKPHYIMF